MMKISEILPRLGTRRVKVRRRAGTKITTRTGKRTKKVVGDKNNVLPLLTQKKFSASYF